MKRKDLIAIAISVLALTGSFFSLYWSQLRSAKIKAVAGEWASAGFNDDKSFWLVLPVTFTNYGARTATVRKIALLMQTPDKDKKESYLLESEYFQKIAYIEENGKKNVKRIVDESFPVPVAVLPRESVNKLVKFTSSKKNQNKFETVEKAGVYPAWLLGWTTTSEEPDLREKLAFELKEDELARLKKDRAGENDVAHLYQSQWSHWRAQSLTDENIKKLLE